MLWPAIPWERGLMTERTVAMEKVASNRLQSDLAPTKNAARERFANEGTPFWHLRCVPAALRRWRRGSYPSLAGANQRVRTADASRVPAHP